MVNKEEKNSSILMYCEIQKFRKKSNKPQVPLPAITNKKHMQCFY